MYCVSIFMTFWTLKFLNNAKVGDAKVESDQISETETRINKLRNPNSIFRKKLETITSKDPFIQDL